MGQGVRQKDLVSTYPLILEIQEARLVLSSFSATAGGSRQLRGSGMLVEEKMR